MKKTAPIDYDYFVHSVSEGSEPAYKGIIPAFGNAVVYGDNLSELEAGVSFTIESEIDERKKSKKPIPAPEKKSKLSGKILLRIKPILHEKLLLEAAANGKSLNAHIQEKLSRGS